MRVEIEPLRAQEWDYPGKMSALGIAITEQNLQLTNLLLSAGADPYDGIVWGVILAQWGRTDVGRHERCRLILSRVLTSQVTAYQRMCEQGSCFEKVAWKRQWNTLMIVPFYLREHDLDNIVMQKFCDLFGPELRKLLSTLITAVREGSEVFAESIINRLIGSRIDCDHDQLSYAIFPPLFGICLSKKDSKLINLLLIRGPRLSHGYWLPSTRRITLRLLRDDDAEILLALLKSAHPIDDGTIKKIWQMGLRKKWIDVLRLLADYGLGAHRRCGLGAHRRCGLWYDECPAATYVRRHCFINDEALDLLVTQEDMLHRDQQICLLNASVEAKDLRLVKKIIQSLSFKPPNTSLDSIEAPHDFPDFLLCILRAGNAEIVAWRSSFADGFGALNTILAEGIKNVSENPWPRFAHPPSTLRRLLASDLHPSRGLLAMCAMSCSLANAENMHIVIESRKTMGTPFSVTDITFCFHEVMGLLTDSIHRANDYDQPFCKCFEYNDYSTNHVEPLRVLAKHGANIEDDWLSYALDDEAQIDNPLIWASIRDQIGLVQAAVRVGNIYMVQSLIKKGFPHSQYEGYWRKSTPLQEAASLSDSEMCRVLLECGAEVNAPASLNGETALQAACFRGNFQLALDFIQAGADINAKAAIESGKTALEAAARHGHLDIVHLLIRNNSDLLKLQKDCKRASRMAEDQSHSVIAKLLENHARKLADELGMVYEDEIDTMCICEIYRHTPSEWCHQCSEYDLVDEAEIDVEYGESEDWESENSDLGREENDMHRLN